MSRVSKQGLLRMTPAEIRCQMSQGSDWLPLATDDEAMEINEHLPPGAVCVDIRGVTFEQFLALNDLIESGWRQ